MLVGRCSPELSGHQNLGDEKSKKSQAPSEVEGSAVQRTFRGNVFRQSVAYVERSAVSPRQEEIGWLSPVPALLALLRLTWAGRLILDTFETESKLLRFGGWRIARLAVVMKERYRNPKPERMTETPPGLVEQCLGCPASARRRDSLGIDAGLDFQLEVPLNDLVDHCRHKLLLFSACLLQVVGCVLASRPSSETASRVGHPDVCVGAKGCWCEWPHAFNSER